MLTQVAIAAASGAVLYQQTLVMLFSDDVHHTRNSIRTVERTRCTLDNLDFLDVMGIDERQFVLSAHVTVNTFAVDQH